MKAIATLSYGSLSFSMELPAKRLPDLPNKTFFKAADLQKLERAAAFWIIEHGVTEPATLRALRAAAGLTGVQLAELLGVDKSQVSRWESGKYDPGVAMWNLVADLALENMRRQISPRARLEAVRARRGKPMDRTIRLKAA